MQPWIQAPPLKVPRYGLAAVNAAAPSPGSPLLIYAIGGGEFSAGDFALNTVETYDPLTQASWSPVVAAMPTPRVGLAAATLGRVHTFGGKDASTQKVVPTHEVYDPATGAWSPARDMPTARSGLAAVATPGGLIYALGGFDGQGNILATVEIYDPSTNNWRTSKPMPTPRANLAAVFFGPDQNIYAIGGRNNNGVLDTVEIFNPQFGWQQSVPLSEPISALAAVAGPKTPRIYAIGGFDRNLTPLASIFSYDPNEVDNGWVELFPMPTARGFLAAVTGSDGLIYAIGGVDQMGQNNVIDNVVGSVEAFTFG